MDMNWQTMLHEAANASFEKDIEVRSAADNDAYSCVDLPKAKIRELSEKILNPTLDALAECFGYDRTVLENLVNADPNRSVPTSFLINSGCRAFR